MAANPMQRQARNSFLLGMIITFVITGAIIGFLFMQVKNLNESLKKERQSIKSVYVLNKDVKSGQVLTSDLFTMKEVKSNGIPMDATSDIATLLSTYSLCDKSGNNIYTKEDGSLFMSVNNQDVNVYKENSTGKYYTQTSTGEKSYIETTEKPLIAKVDMKANTVITGSFIVRSDEIDSNDVRKQEYNMVILPIDLETEDYVDIRLMLPTGQDYIVVSKKRVTIPDVNGEYLPDTIMVKMTEDEILTMSSAIIDAYRMDGSKLYATKYTDAGIQEASTPTYVVNNETASLIESDPNIVAEYMAALSARYNANNGALKNMRNQYINSAIETYGNDSGITAGMQDSITSSQEARQEYLESLVGTSTN